MKTLPLIALVAALVTAPAEATSLINAFNGPGDTAIIAHGADGFPCFDTVANLRKALDAASANDEAGFTAIDAFHAVTLTQGTHVLVLADTSAIMGGAVRLRLESGNHAGIACWAEGDIPDAVTHVRHHSGT